MRTTELDVATTTNSHLRGTTNVTKWSPTAGYNFLFYSKRMEENSHYTRKALVMSFLSDPSHSSIVTFFRSLIHCLSWLVISSLVGLFQHQLESTQGSWLKLMVSIFQHTIRMTFSCSACIAEQMNLLSIIWSITVWTLYCIISLNLKSMFSHWPISTTLYLIIHGMKFSLQRVA